MENTLIHEVVLQLSIWSSIETIRKDFELSFIDSKANISACQQNFIMVQNA